MVFNLERHDHAHLYGIRHHCSSLPRNTIFGAGAGNSLATWAESPPAQSEPGTVIRTIQVVDVKELQPAVRSKVDEIISQTSDEDMQSLRKTIDATPQAVSALKAKGVTSSQVVAINIADGILTMFTKTA